MPYITISASSVCQHGVTFCIILIVSILTMIHNYPASYQCDEIWPNFATFAKIF